MMRLFLTFALAIFALLHPAFAAPAHAATVNPATFGPVDCSGQAPSQAALQNALSARKGPVALQAGCKYRITSTLVCPPNGPNDPPIGFVGPGILYGRAEDFNNKGLAYADKIGPHTDFINCSGQNKGANARPIYNVLLHGFTLQSEVKQGRYLVGILVQNAHNLEISRVEMFGFPMAMGISADTIFDSRITGNYIHDFYDNTPWPSQPQSTAIELDNERVVQNHVGVSSDDVIITGNVIRNIELGPIVIAKYMYQTDGINTEAGTHLSVSRNNISHVDEAIDNWASHSVFLDNDISFATAACLKNLYSASYNYYAGNKMVHCGLFGFGLTGSTIGDVQNNVIVGNIISDVDPDLIWSKLGHSTGAIYLDNINNPRYFVHDNLFVDNSIDPGAQGKFALIDTTTDGARGNTLIGTMAPGRLGLNLDRGGKTLERLIAMPAPAPWKPTIGGAATPGSASYGSQTGTYKKIGNLLLVTFDVAASALGGASGDIVIGGLPSRSLKGGAGVCGLSSATGVRFDPGYMQPGAAVAPGDTRIRLREFGATMRERSLTTANIAGATRIAGSCVIGL